MFKCPSKLLIDQGLDETNIAVVYLSGSKQKIEGLKTLNNENCFFRAWFRFARILFVDQKTAVDIRYSNTRRDNFTKITFDDFLNKDCPTRVPGWIAPREALVR